jgi:hypothetical protein
VRLSVIKQLLKWYVASNNQSKIELLKGKDRIFLEKTGTVLGLTLLAGGQLIEKEYWLDKSQTSVIEMTPALRFESPTLLTLC